MKVRVKRLICNDDSTLGMLYIDEVFQCFTLENGIREIKVHGETRIPSGTYNLSLRKAGSMNAKYGKKFNFHKGMIHVEDVPDFKYIYIHIGNSKEDTEGCILVGLTLGKSTLGHSTAAYELIYPIISQAIDAGEDVRITIEDERENENLPQD